MDIPQHERGTLSLEAHTHEAKLAFHHVCRRQMDKMDSIGHAATMDDWDSMESEWTSRNMNVEFCFCEAGTHELKLAFHHVRQLDKVDSIGHAAGMEDMDCMYSKDLPGLWWTVWTSRNMNVEHCFNEVHTHTRSKAVIPSCLPSTDGQDGQLPSTDEQGGLLRPCNNHGQHGLRGQQGPTRTSAT